MQLSLRNVLQNHPNPYATFIKESAAKSSNPYAAFIKENAAKLSEPLCTLHSEKSCLIILTPMQLSLRKVLPNHPNPYAAFI